MDNNNYVIGASIIIAAVTTLIYKYIVKPHRYWLEKGVKQGRPLPILGDLWSQFVRYKSFPEMVQDIYNIAQDVRYVGIYANNTPILVLRDPELIKNMLIKNGDHFLNRFPSLPENVDPFWDKNLFALTGKKWHDMRTTLSPSFTSSKMKQMFALMVNASKQFCNYFLAHNHNQQVTVLEMKDVFTRFTNDVIASTAFGVRVDSLKNRENEFYSNGKELTNFAGFRKSMKLVIITFFPTLTKLLRLGFFEPKVTHFFGKLIAETIETRERNNTYRPDMIQLMMEAKKKGEGQEQEDDGGEVAEPSFAAVADEQSSSTTTTTTAADAKSTIHRHAITNDDITAQALLFFFAGFESVAQSMTFTIYELAVNTDVQQRLRREVDSVLADCPDQTITYQTLHQMKYLDMVVCESLRKWPIAPAVDRVCTKPFMINAENSDETTLYVAKKDMLWLPIYGIHRDPKHYPNPDRFDPERFNDANKGQITAGTYLPFGVGPRNCIASRFALLEIKTITCELLKNFEIVPVEKTAIPLKLNKASFNVGVEGGVWVGLKRRHYQTT